MPFVRPLHSSQPPARVDSLIAPAEVEPADYEALFSQRFIDTAALASNIRAVVPPRSRVDLAEILTLFPVEDGVAEILGYLSLSGEEIDVEMHDDQEMTIDYTDPAGTMRRVRLPHTTVARK